MTASETATLADGRMLCFARYGAPEGRPVLYCHGAGSSRLEGEVYDKEARAAGVQVIAADRPGCGGSSPKARWTFTSYAADLQELADVLGIGRFVVAGMSNGGAYAMAAAAAMPDRVTAAIPINASTPVHDPVARKATPMLVRLSYALMKYGLGVHVTRRSVNRLVRSAGIDARVRRRIAECLRQPDSGYLRQELRLASSEWGFDHAAIRQPVEMFYGDGDAGYRYGRIWAGRLPKARLHVFAGGHGDFGLPDPRKRIVEAMASAP